MTQRDEEFIGEVVGEAEGEAGTALALMQQPTQALAHRIDGQQRAEIDVQVATAHQWPRSMALFQKRAMAMVSLDEETAASCIYRRPVGRDGGGGGQKIVEGESIRLAEIVAASFGNIRHYAEVVNMGESPRYVRARGFAHDLETNNAACCEVVEATVDKSGKPYSERQRALFCKVACAKAERDAIFKVVPKALCKTITNEARRVAVGTVATLAVRRTRVLQWVDGLKIDRSRVYAVLGIKGEAEIGLDQLETLTGLRTAIRDNDVKPEDAFPAPTSAPVNAEPAQRMSMRTPAAVPKSATAPVTGRPKPTRTAPAPTEEAPAATPTSETTAAPAAPQPGAEATEAQIEVAAQAANILIGSMPPAELLAWVATAHPDDLAYGLLQTQEPNFEAAHDIKKRQIAYYAAYNALMNKRPLTAAK